MRFFTSSLDSKWRWLNWFCNDETGVDSDTFNRCQEKGWVVTSRDTSTSTLTNAGRTVISGVR